MDVVWSHRCLLDDVFGGCCPGVEEGVKEHRDVAGVGRGGVINGCLVGRYLSEDEGDAGAAVGDGVCLVLGVLWYLCGGEADELVVVDEVSEVPDERGPVLVAGGVLEGGEAEPGAVVEGADDAFWGELWMSSETVTSSWVMSSMETVGRSTAPSASVGVVGAIHAIFRAVRIYGSESVRWGRCAGV